MTLSAAEELAWDLMELHGLTPRWKFQWDSAKRRAGCCSYRDKCIRLSIPITRLNPESEVRNTILHEIAHALEPKDGHGDAWKRRCVAIGARPERCFGEEKVVPEAPYLAVCANCQYTYGIYKRTVALTEGRKYHTSCGPTKGAMRIKRNSNAS